MRAEPLGLTVCALLAALTSSVRADNQVTFDANSSEQATADFKFEHVPSPSGADAANSAKFRLIDGRRDSNGADVDCLNDGTLPSDEDAPGANFFLAAGSSGGRLLVDLEQPTDVQFIATYSWHPGARGPQVYKLYAGIAEDKDFDASTAGKVDKVSPTQWKLLAEVDTRIAGQDSGGQYGVKISGDQGKLLGKHRYLLFDIVRTGGHPQFDHTFFSEIDVVDGQQHPPAKRPEPVVDVLKVGQEYEIAFDTTQTPELRPWVDEKLKPVCAEWYPRIVKLLPSDEYQAPRRFAIVFEKDMRGVAYTAGARVVCAGPWFKQNLDGEAAGAVVHELVHVVQQYGRARSGNRSPGWMVEGLADYIRWFLYEPEALRPRPDPNRAHYTDSYRTTAAFLDYVVDKYDGDAIKKFNAAMRTGAYSDDLWKDYTGKSADELWEEYVEDLKK